jgi:hypothetical protein
MLLACLKENYVHFTEVKQKYVTSKYAVDGGGLPGYCVM